MSLNKGHEINIVALIKHNAVWLCPKTLDKDKEALKVLRGITGYARVTPPILYMAMIPTSINLRDEEKVGAQEPKTNTKK